jgi:hypothetical protein
MMKSRFSTRYSGIMTVLVLMAIAPFSQGQYQVSQPGEAGPNAPGANPNGPNTPDRAAGVELYGNNNRDKPVRYPAQTGYLPSETLIATQRSGATPSELRTQADAAGPLSTNGPADYIPVLSPLQRAVGASQPTLFGPAWLTQPVTSYRVPRAPTGELNSSANRHGDPRAIPGRSPLEVTPGALPPIQPSDIENRYIAQRIPVGQPLGPVTSVNTTVNRPIRYTRPQTQPATKPAATQPSLAPTAQVK